MKLGIFSVLLLIAAASSLLDAKHIADGKDDGMCFKDFFQKHPEKTVWLEGQKSHFPDFSKMPSCDANKGCQKSLKCCHSPCGMRCMKPLFENEDHFEPAEHGMEPFGKEDERVTEADRKLGMCPHKYFIKHPELKEKLKEQFMKNKQFPPGSTCKEEEGKECSQHGKHRGHHMNFPNFTKMADCAADSDCSNNMRCCRSPCGVKCIKSVFTDEDFIKIILNKEDNDRDKQKQDEEDEEERGAGSEHGKGNTKSTEHGKRHGKGFQHGKGHGANQVQEGEGRQKRDVSEEGAEHGKVAEHGKGHGKGAEHGKGHGKGLEHGKGAEHGKGHGKGLEHGKGAEHGKGLQHEKVDEQGEMEVMKEENRQKRSASEKGAEGETHGKKHVKGHDEGAGHGKKHRKGHDEGAENGKGHDDGPKHGKKHGKGHGEGEKHSNKHGKGHDEGAEPEKGHGEGAKHGRKHGKEHNEGEEHREKHGKGHDEGEEHGTGHDEGTKHGKKHGKRHGEGEENRKKHEKGHDEGQK